MTDKYTPTIDELALALWQFENETYGVDPYVLGGWHDDQAAYLREHWLAAHDREVAEQGEL